jgi:ParB family chromosome partitioning protein
VKTSVGLGRGLGALIPTGATALQELPVGSIVPNRRQPRRAFDEEGLATLAASMRQVGVLQPVVVRSKEDGRFELVLGERRWRAARRAGLANVPALVVETDDRGALQRAVVENIHRQDLNPLEEAAAYQQLIEEGGLTHEQLAEQLGLSRPSISNTLRLLDLPPSVQRMVMEGKLSAGHARALLPLAENPLLERVAARVAGEGLSVRQAEELSRRYSIEGKAATSPGGKRRLPAGMAELSERLSEELNTRVTVAMGRRKGKIVIELGSREDLERVARRLLGRAKT